MKVNYDGNTKKFTVDVSTFDRIVNGIIVIIICGCVLYGIFKPDIKGFLMSIKPEKQTEEVVFTDGNQLSWQEYRSIIGNKKLMKQYAKKKNVVTGYLHISTSDNGGNYTAVLTEGSDTDNFTVFVIKFSRKKYMENLKDGTVTVASENIYCGDGYSYLYCIDPIVTVGN